MSIVMLTRTVYRSPRARRDYLTLRAAINAEARKIIEARYPMEHPEYDAGHTTYPGFHWQHDLPRANVLYRRMARIIRASYEAAKKGGAS